jgi:alanine dehydrogenase
VVVVHDESSGQVRAVAIGNELGPRRTGAIGALAADELAPADARTVAVIGSGVQAYTQVWALSAVSRPVGDGITVFFSAGLAGTEAFLLDRMAQG